MTTDVAKPYTRPSDVPEGVATGMALKRAVNVDEAIACYGYDAVRRVCDHMSWSDEPAYLAFKEIKERRFSWAQYYRALDEGLDSAERPPPTVRDYFAELTRVPDWVDWDQLYRGAVAYWRAGQVVPFVVANGGLGASWRNYGGSKPLVFSRRLIEPAQTGRRLQETMRWLVHSTTPGGMTRFGQGFKLTARVRMLHAATRYFLSRSQAWDWDDWGQPVDFADTLSPLTIVFTRSVVEGLRKVGIRLSDTERTDMYALFRYIGFVIGAPEEILPANERESLLHAEIFSLLDHPADDGCRSLLHAQVDFTCRESLGGYRVLPEWTERFLTLERKKALIYGLIRGWAGDEIAEQLAIPKNGYRHLLTVAKPALLVKDRVSRRRPDLDEQRAFKTLEAFAAAIELKAGMEPIANPDEVVAEMSQHQGRVDDYLGRARAR